MSISDTTETALLNLVFRAVAWANYADNAAGTPQTNISNALHTADPGDAGTMTTSEATYGSYARVDVARTTGGWSAPASGAISPVASIDFPAAASGSNTITHWSTGKTGGGAAAILMSGTVTPNIAVSTPIQPKLSTSSTLTLD